MKKLLLLFLASINFHSLYAQKEANIWYFGNAAGMDFNSGAPVALTNGQLFTTEGSASIADAGGNLLFYTEGVSVYNRNHVVMPNGSGLLGGTSASQSAIILPLPGSSTQYYIFTVPNTASDFLRYSIVDMTLAGGNGDITIKNIGLGGVLVAEKLTATWHRNGTDFWVAAHDNGGNAFYVYQVSASGVTGPIISNVGSMHIGTNPWTGCMKFSPKGDKMAVCLYGTQQADLLDFDNLTGVFSNPATHNFASTFSTYGVEFSETGRVLYICNVDFLPGQIFQYDMLAGSNAAILATGQLVYNNSTDILGSMQLAPDKKVYFVRYGLPYAAAIEFPEILGAGCSPNDVAVPLGTGVAQLGLPDFFSGIFRIPILYSGQCLGDTTFFTIVDTANLASVDWNFRDNASGIYNTSTLFNPYHIFTNTGNYLVQLISTYQNSFVDTVIIPVHIYPNVNVNLGLDTNICQGSSITLNAFSSTATDYLWQDSSTASTFIADTTGAYIVTASNPGCSATDTINVNLVPCNLPDAQFQTADETICPGTCIDFTNMSINATSFIWSFPGANPSVSTDANPSGICFNLPGNYDVTLIASDGTTSDTLILSDYISVFPFPAPQGILQNGDTLIANQGAVSYQWFHNGNAVAGATNYFYVAVSSGNYNVVCTDANGCEVEAVLNDVIAAINQFPVTSSQLAIFPNPVNKILSIRLPGKMSMASVTIYNFLGELIFTDAPSFDLQLNEIQIDCSSYSDGLYFIEITNGNSVYRERFVKQ